MMRALLAATLVFLVAAPARADRPTYNRYNREIRALIRAFDALNRPVADTSPPRPVPRGYTQPAPRTMPTPIERMGGADRRASTEAFQNGLDMMTRIMGEANLTDAERAELLSRMAERVGVFFQQVTEPFADAEGLSRSWTELREREQYGRIGAAVQFVGDRFIRLGRGLLRDVVRIPFVVPLGRDWQRSHAALAMSRTLTNAIDDELERRGPVAWQPRAWHRIRHLQDRDNPIPADAGLLSRMMQHPVRYLSALTSWIGDRIWNSPRVAGRTVLGVANVAVNTGLWFWNLVPIYRDRETGAIRFGYTAAAQQAVERETRRRTQASPEMLLPAAYRMVFERMLASEPFRWGPGNDGIRASYLGLAAYLFLCPWELTVERTTYSPLFFAIAEAGFALSQRHVRWVDGGMASFHEVNSLLRRIESDPAREEIWNSCGSLVAVPEEVPDTGGGS